MWKIRRKVSSQNERAAEDGDLSDIATPRAFSRGLLLHMRLIHKVHSVLSDACARLSADQRKAYEDIVSVDLRPSFDEVLRLIDRAQHNGLLTDDEALGLRAGQVFEIASPETTKRT